MTAHACNGRFYAGWDSTEAETLAPCLAICIAEPQCAYAAFLQGQTCTRYDARAGDCAAGGSADHTVYAKMQSAACVRNE